MEPLQQKPASTIGKVLICVIPGLRCTSQTVVPNHPSDDVFQQLYSNSCPFACPSDRHGAAYLCRYQVEQHTAQPSMNWQPRQPLKVVLQRQQRTLFRGLLGQLAIRQYPMPCLRYHSLLQHCIHASPQAVPERVHPCREIEYPCLQHSAHVYKLVRRPLL